MRPIIPLRTSPAVWATPFLIIASVLAYKASYPGFPLSVPYWDAVVARASSGFYYELPLAAGLAAWTSNRFARSRDRAARRPARSVLRIVWAQTWPIFLASGLAYIGAGVTVLLELGRLPSSGSVSPLLLLAFAGMVVAAVIFGYIVGLFVYSAVAFPVVVFAMYEWIIYPQLDGDNVSWRNISGYSVYGCCDVLNYQADPRALIAPAVLAVAMIVVVWLLRRFRLGWAALPSAAVLVASFVIANGLVIGTQATPSELRSASDLQCAGATPTVCTWPEVEDPQRVRKELRDASSALTKRGYVTPRVIQPSASRVLDSSAVEVDVEGTTFDSVAAAYGQGLAKHGTCSVPDGIDPDSYVQGVGYSLAVLAGAAPDKALPQLFTVADGGQSSAPMSEAEVRSYLGFSGSDTEQSVVAAWNREQSHCPHEGNRS